MNKPKQQGTAWETEFVRRAQDSYLIADRLAEGGINDAGDVWIGTPPDPRFDDGEEVVAVAWKRLTGSGNSRRTPDGERDVVVLRTDDFFRLALYASGGVDSIVVECKARQNLNVTRTLAKTARKLANWKAQRQ